MVANIGDVIVIIDHEGINRYKSPNVEKLFGWKPEELIGNNAFDNVHPDDIDKGQSFIASLLSEPNKTGTSEVRYRHKNGDYVWIEFTGSNLFHDPIINGILGSYHDISERKMAEKMLQEKNDVLQRVFDNNFDLISIADIEGNNTFVSKSHEIWGMIMIIFLVKILWSLCIPKILKRLVKSSLFFLTQAKNERLNTVTNALMKPIYGLKQ
jgi:PAS domain S-box-containing protein